MCTLTAHRSVTGWLITMTRDERRTRGEAKPPFIWDDSNILAPQDTDAGGTWIGVNKSGVWACLLNGYLPDTENKIKTPKTRGRLIPDCLADKDPVEIIQGMDFSSTHAFRLWIGHRTGITEFFWDLTKLHKKELPATDWAFVSSSSMKQTEVLAFRQELFENWVNEGAPMLSNGVPKLHLDNGKQDPEWDIFMAREYSHTKSLTQIVTDEKNVTMKHWDRDYYENAEYTNSF